MLTRRRMPIRIYWPPVEIEEDVPVIDVHPPHEPMHGWRDFFLHLTTITIGLLIALSLEAAVEWQHHRHLAHEAEASLHSEIEHNANSIVGAIDDLHKQQHILQQDVAVLRYIEKNKKAPEKSSINISFRSAFASPALTTSVGRPRNPPERSLLHALRHRSGVRQHLQHAESP